MKRAVLISSLGFVAALAVGGCGINAKHIVTQVVHVPTNGNFARTTPTGTTGVTGATGATGASAAASGVGGSGSSGPTPPPSPTQSSSAPIAPQIAISNRTATATAAGTASALANRIGDTVPPAAWQVSCYGGPSWTCPVSAGGCAGTITVAVSGPTDQVRGRSEDFACAD